MRVLLVKPYNLSDHIQPSLGLGYLAARIMDSHEVEILDCIKEKMDLPAFRKYVKDTKPDLVGFQTYTFDIPFVREAIEAVKEIDPQIKTLVGGPHPSSVPERVFEDFKSVDAGFRGEAEIGFKQYVDGAPPETIPGLIYRENGQVRINEPRFADDLDELGMPAWELIKPENYPESQHGFFFQKFPIAPIMLTRGCPYKCTFCAANLVSSRKHRRRSVESVMGEINYLYHDRGIREFHIIDDNFSMNRKYVMEFLNALKDADLDISWATPNGVRMNTLSEEMLALMKETGLYLITLGIESGSDRILQLMRKDLTVAETRRYVEMIDRAGIDIAGFFILGFPTETPEEMMKTIKLSLELPLIRANYPTYLPFPGTECYQMIEAEGELEGIDWDHFYFMNAPYVPRGMSRKRLKHIQSYAFIRFYARPRPFLKTMSGIKSPRHFWFLLKRLYHWLIM